MRLRAALTMLCLVAVCATLLTGCACAPAAPLSDRGRMTIYRESIDRTWDQLHEEYPDAVRPPVDIQVTRAGQTWAGKVNACLAARDVPGVTVSATRGIFVQSGAALWPNDSEAVDVAIFACTAPYPTTDELAELLSDAQLSALYDYYVTFVEPCMLGAGHRVTGTPSRARFISDYYTRISWSPSNYAYLGRPSVDALARRCPPKPAWLSSR